MVQRTLSVFTTARSHHPGGAGVKTRAHPIEASDPPKKEPSAVAWTASGWVILSRGELSSTRRRPRLHRPTKMGFRAPLHQGARHARQLHLHQRRAASSSLFEQSSSAPKLETADDHRTCGGSTPWPVGPHLLVQATELLPPMSAAEQRSKPRPLGPYAVTSMAV